MRPTNTNLSMKLGQNSVISYTSNKPSIASTGVAGRLARVCAVSALALLAFSGMAQAAGDPEAGAGTFDHGTITLTTAEGDTLVLAQVGHAGGVPGAEGLIGWMMGGSWDVASGTGQFEGVSGHGWIGGLGDIPGDAAYRFEGYLDDGTAE